MNLSRLCAEHSSTGARDWRRMEGPDSGCGVDSWLRNDIAGLEANVNIDQDEAPTVEITPIAWEEEGEASIDAGDGWQLHIAADGSYVRASEEGEHLEFWLRAKWARLPTRFKDVLIGHLISAT